MKHKPSVPGAELIWPEGKLRRLMVIVMADLLATEQFVLDSKLRHSWDQLVTKGVALDSDLRSS